MKEVEIIISTGDKIEVLNPLLAYVFHPPYDEFPSPFDKWKETRRFPSCNKTADTGCRIERLKKCVIRLISYIPI